MWTWVLGLTPRWQQPAWMSSTLSAAVATSMMSASLVRPLGDVADKRTPEYIMNMILDTETMIENDDTVKCLLQEFLTRMPNQNVDEKDARNVLEHLRDHAAKN